MHVAEIRVLREARNRRLWRQPIEGRIFRSATASMTAMVLGVIAPSAAKPHGLRLVIDRSESVFRLTNMDSQSATTAIRL